MRERVTKRILTGSLIRNSYGDIKVFLVEINIKFSLNLNQF